MTPYEQIHLAATQSDCGRIFPPVLLREILMFCVNVRGTYHVTTVDQFNHLMEHSFKHQIVFVSFVTHWCHHCDAMKSEFDKASWQAVVPFVQVTCEDPLFLHEFEVESFPSFTHVKNGKAIGKRFAGLPRSAQNFEDFVYFFAHVNF